MPAIHRLISLKCSSHFIPSQLLLIIVTFTKLPFYLFASLIWCLDMSYSGSLVHNNLPLASQDNTDVVYWLLAVIYTLADYEFMSGFQFAGSNSMTLNFSDSLNSWPSDYFPPQYIMIIFFSKSQSHFISCISLKMQLNLWTFTFDCSPYA